jgi:hypothetical protein
VGAHLAVGLGGPVAATRHMCTPSHISVQVVSMADVLQTKKLHIA